MPLLASLLCIALAFGAAADNPRISLKVENATCAEAAAQLAQASGVPVQLHPSLSGSAAAPRLAERAGFDWSGLSFARALRQLCERYGLQPEGSRGGYTLKPTPPGAAPPRWGLTEKQGVRLFVSGTRYEGHGGFIVVNGQVLGPGSILSVEVGYELPEGDAGGLLEIDNVSARDDRGTLLEEPPDAERRPRICRKAVFPDEGFGTAYLTAPDPRAKRLRWVRGDLILRKELQTRIEVPLPEPGKTSRSRAGEGVLEVLSCTGGETLQGLGAGPRLAARVSLPIDLAARVRNDSITPELVTASGQSYPPLRTSSARRLEGNVRRYEFECAYPPLDGEPAKVRVTLAEPAPPEKLLTFSLADIPLPANPPRFGFEPVRTPGSLSVPTTWSCYQWGGGTLVSQV